MFGQSMIKRGSRGASPRPTPFVHCDALSAPIGLPWSTNRADLREFVRQEYRADASRWTRAPAGLDDATPAEQRVRERIERARVRWQDNGGVSPFRSSFDVATAIQTAGPGGGDDLGLSLV